MTPLERAARALHERLRPVRRIRDPLNIEAPPIEKKERGTDWDSITDEQRAERIDQARAVLLAIREPSEGMGQAMIDITGDTHFQKLDGSSYAQADVYKAMIDAALTE